MPQGEVLLSNLPKVSIKGHALTSGYFPENVQYLCENANVLKCENTEENL